MAKFCAVKLYFPSRMIANCPNAVLWLRHFCYIEQYWVKTSYDTQHQPDVEWCNWFMTCLQMVWKNNARKWKKSIITSLWNIALCEGTDTFGDERQSEQKPAVFRWECHCSKRLNQDVWNRLPRWAHESQQWWRQDLPGKWQRLAPPAKPSTGWYHGDGG